MIDAGCLRGRLGDRQPLGASGVAIGRTIAAGAQLYRREIMLPRLLPIGPREASDPTPEGRLAVLKRLARALRSERSRGRSGHWSYSLDRHIGLLQAYQAERASLGRERSGRLGRPGGNHARG